MDKDFMNTFLACLIAQAVFYAMMRLLTGI
jgi:hypothetical protein